MSHSLETRKKRLGYRTNHTGTRETDILVGGFVSRHGDDLDEQAIGALEALLDGANDRDILDWITERAPLPERFRNDLTAQLITFVKDRSRS